MSHHSYHLHAISWNDRGIECMKHRQYQQAICHFQTSLRCIKQLLADEGEEEDGDDMHHLSNTTVVCNPIASSKDLENRCHDDDNVRQQQVDVFSSDTKMMTTIPNKNDTVPLQSSYSVSLDDKEWQKFRPICIALPAVKENDDEDTFALDRFTCIVLYNMGICYIHSNIISHSQYHPVIGNDTAKSSYRASHVLNLSYQLLGRMVSKFGIVNENTIQAWYGLHQIEYRILSAMMFWMPRSSYSSIPQDDETDADHTTTMIIDRMREVHDILIKNRDLVYFLVTIFSITTVAAPCA